MVPCTRVADHACYCNVRDREHSMSTARLIEHRITRQLLQRREAVVPHRGYSLWVERLIAVLAVTAGLSIVGSYFEEMLWILLASATLATLR
jgi:hypothetical protein